MIAKNTGTRLVVGDVIEIDTGVDGLAYAQYANRARLYGTLIRVLPGLYRSRPDVAELVHGPTRYWVFYPVASSAKDGLVTVVGNFPLPKGAHRIPAMKSRGVVDATGHVLSWTIVEEERRKRVTELTREERALPTLQVVNHPRLVEWVLGEYSPEHDVR